MNYFLIDNYNQFINEIQCLFSEIKSQCNHEKNYNSEYNINQKDITNFFYQKNRNSEFNFKSILKNLIEFQSINKYLFMFLSPNLQKKMGNLVANLTKDNFQNQIIKIEKFFNELIDSKSTIGGFINTSQHIFGYYSKNIEKMDRDSFLNSLNDFEKSDLSYRVILKELYERSLFFENSYLIKQTIFYLVNKY